MTNEDIELAKEKLLQLSYMEGTELGEMWRALTKLHDYQEHLPDTFVMALEELMKEQYEWTKEHTRIVQRTVTKTYTIKELVFDE